VAPLSEQKCSACYVVQLRESCCEIFQKVDDLWDLLDAESTSFMAYDDFMRYYLGEMDEYRKFLVIKVSLCSVPRCLCCSCRSIAVFNCCDFSALCVCVFVCRNILENTSCKYPSSSRKKLSHFALKLSRHLHASVRSFISSHQVAAATALLILRA